MLPVPVADDRYKSWLKILKDIAVAVKSNIFSRDVSPTPMQKGWLDPMMTHETTRPVDKQEETHPPAFPSYSTYWMPLDEPRQTWATSGADFGTKNDLAATLQATAHAFFALAHETKALRQFSLAAEQERHGLFARHAGYWYGQAEQALCEATRHWSRAAYELDVLSASDGLCPDGLDDARAMSRAAREQQERLWKLTDEVRATLIGWRTRQQQQEEATR